MSKKGAPPTPISTVITFLNNTIATFGPNSNSTQPSTEDQPATTNTSSRKRKSPYHPPPATSPSTPPSSPPPSTEEKSAKQAQKEKAAKKKSECGYRGSRVERGDEVDTVGGKVFVEKVKLIDEEFMGAGEAKKVIEVRSKIVEPGVKVEIFGVEGQRAVLG